MAVPKSILEELAQTLEGVGLSQSEIKVFIFLLQHDKGLKVSDISKKTKLNRTTLYGLLTSLTNKGLISHIDERGVLRYRSIEPGLLVGHIERAKERLSAGATRVEKMIPLFLSERTSGSTPYPSVKFFEGKDGIKQIYEDTIKNNKGKTLYGFLGADAGLDFMGYDWINSYIAARKKYGVKAYTVATDTPALRGFKSRDSNELRDTKLLPPGYEFELEMVVYDNKVLIASFRPEQPLAVLIEDAEIARLMKAVFRYVDSTLSDK